jgi:DNA-binding LytR/AlgR family response regulator
MKKINCLIADDEVLARDVIIAHSSKLERLNVVAACANGLEVYNYIRDQAIDLLFLDIQMPHLGGIELLRTIKTSPAVIITTAYSEFALEGYELNVIDYLLKPISFERFLKAIDKYETWVHPAHLNYNGPVEKKYDADGFIYVKSEKKMVKIILKNILYIAGLKDYVKIYTTDMQVITYQTLSYFEEKLSTDQFIRIHRSYIVSVRHISAFSATEITIGNLSMPIGNSYAKQVYAILDQKQDT